MPGSVRITYLADIHQTNATTKAVGELKAQLRGDRPTSVSFFVELSDIERANELAASITDMGSNALRRWVKQNIYIPGARQKLKRRASEAMQDKFLGIQDLLKTAKGLGIGAELIPFDHPSTPSLGYLAVCIADIKKEIKPFVEDEEVLQKLHGLVLFELSYLLTMAAFREEYMTGLLKAKRSALEKVDGHHVVYIFTGLGHTASLEEMQADQKRPEQEILGHTGLVDHIDEIRKRFMEAAARLTIDSLDLISFMKKLLSDISATESARAISEMAPALITDAVDKLLAQNDTDTLDAALNVCAEYYKMAEPGGELAA